MGLRILVVEDNPLNMQLVRDILELRGHGVATAADVAEGRARLREGKPDLVLLDIQIPGGGGEALLRDIRAQEALSGLPVIAVTAQAMEGDRQRALAAGFDGYVTKPINTRTFATEVESFVRPV